jgi:release factor H-coupled RctB family protein
LTKEYTLIANEKCWIEDSSLIQLKKTASFPGIERAVGLPDLHIGTTPVGAVFSSSTVIHPSLLGSDIGCGMGFFESEIAVKKFKQDKVLSYFQELYSLKDINFDNPYTDNSPIKELGSIGGGNHFAEFQVLEKVYLKDEFKALAIDSSKIFLLVHSGSRDYGQKISQEFLNLDGFPVAEKIAKDFLSKQKDALLWAKRNRLVIALKVLGYTSNKGEGREVLDSSHNYIEEFDGIYIHRKGAVSSLLGPVVIPGSRGTLSYLVKPTEDTEKSLYSLSHGAGRKWPRGLCKGRLSEKYKKNQIYATKLKSVVVSHDKDLLFEEAPEAFKNITDIIAALVEAGLCEVICAFRPLITLKI